MTKTVTTPELKVGDIVHRYGMRVELDREPVIMPPRWEGEQGRSFRGRVLNHNGRHPYIPESWFYEEVWVDGKGWTVDRESGPRWTIQGNELAHWEIEDGRSSTDAD